MSPLSHQRGDGELMRQILEETAVATRPAGPDMTAYLTAWIEAAMRWMGGFFGGGSRLATGILTAILVIALAGLAFALVLIAVSAARRLRGRGARGTETSHPGWTEVAEGGPAVRDRAAWRSEIEARLSRGDVAGALEALWWWFATSLPLESGIDSTWTTRELLLKARRRELLGLGAALDTLMYGRRSPSPADVSAWLARLEAKLT